MVRNQTSLDLRYVAHKVDKGKMVVDSGKIVNREGLGVGVLCGIDIDFSVK